MGGRKKYSRSSAFRSPFSVLHFLCLCSLFSVLSLFSSVAYARYPSNSIVYVRPSIDAGRYIVTEQSQGLYQWGYNIGMNMNSLPVSGIPLPFVSYGGSALWTFLFGIGLVESVVLRHKQIEF